MKKKKPSTDLNVIAHDILQAITGQPAGTTSVKREPVDVHTKNPAAVALGRLGGLKGGKARAEKLSAKKRAEIARKAAVSRWKRS
ncbi:hypothetical protein [Candidatus Nitrospira nitrificans]|uniref:Histone H1 n=1 Tax=Candidatus Nitrospira nitrificans TaxID=1742973 RepID=A0A0S4LC79_9BACT|nr:hypothetical protein [Candidatus Nitrospira nitrificans]CUS33499.1 conserved hypothetical protein [Candidatus Nitrospira nitrificans]